MVCRVASRSKCACDENETNGNESQTSFRTQIVASQLTSFFEFGSPWLTCSRGRRKDSRNNNEPIQDQLRVAVGTLPEKLLTVLPSSTGRLEPVGTIVGREPS